MAPPADAPEAFVAGIAGAMELPENFCGIIAREVPGCGVAAFAAQAFAPGDVVLSEAALQVSSVSALDGGKNRQLWEGLVNFERTRRLPAFEPSGHLGALAALRDLGVAGCRARLLTKCIGPEEALPSIKEAKREVVVLRSAVGTGLVPSSASTFQPEEYAKLRKVFVLNGFRYNGIIQEGESGYDVGEALFDKVSRINHSCEPNLRFDLTSREDGSIHICVTAMQAIQDGEEVNISYLPLKVRQTLSGEQRRRKLREQWLFDCGCRRCSAECCDSQRKEDHRDMNAESTSATAAKSLESKTLYPTAQEERPRASSDSSSQGMCFDDLADPDG